MITSAEEFVALRISEDHEVYERAGREEAPLEVWWEVIRLYPEMREWVAYNKTVPVEVLSVLADDPDPRVRYFVAMKRKLSVEIFEKLVVDQDESVRVRIARNPKVPEFILRKLVTDESSFVREIANSHLMQAEA